MKRKIRKFGYIPDLPDHRDFRFQPKYGFIRLLWMPPVTDLRLLCPPIYDQGDLGSCTANAIAAAIEFDRKKQKLDDWTPSRLFIYYNERVIENTVDQDSGAMIRDGIQSVNTVGACHETIWPYDITQFATKPTDQAYDDGAQHVAVKYERIDQDLNDMKSCLAEGYPFVAGFTVYDGFQTDAVAQTGTVNLPTMDESPLGGHAILVVGYNNTTQRFICRNSWGTDWGMQGYFTMPYAYLGNENLANDFWKISIVG